MHAKTLAFAVALASPLAFTAACAATGNAPQTPVSYTHLTLPTIYSV